MESVELIGYYMSQEISNISNPGKGQSSINQQNQLVPNNLTGNCLKESSIIKNHPEESTMFCGDNDSDLALMIRDIILPVATSQNLTNEQKTCLDLGIAKKTEEGLIGADCGIGQSSINHQRIPERRCLEESSIVESHLEQWVEKEEEFPDVDASHLTRKTFLTIGTPQNLESGPVASINFGQMKKIETDSSVIGSCSTMHESNFPNQQYSIVEPFHLTMSKCENPNSNAGQNVLCFQDGYDKRATFMSNENRRILEAHFSREIHPDQEQIGRIVNETDLPEKMIKTWFRNSRHRRKDRQLIRRRTFLNDDQRRILDAYFAKYYHLNEEQLGRVINETGLPKEMVRRWFINRRCKSRKLIATQNE